MKRGVARALLGLLLAWFFAAASPATAHLMPNSVVNLDFGSRAVSAEILMPVNELSYATGRRFALHAGPDLGADRAFLQAYVLEHLAVTAPDRSVRRGSIDTPDRRPVAKVRPAL
jgi:hypothetical protein